MQADVRVPQPTQESGVDAARLCRIAAGQTGLTLKNIDRIGQVIGLRLVIDGPEG